MRGRAPAVGFYNEFGGYTIGQVWKDPDQPNPKPAATDGFPNGTVVCKTLFVKAPQSVIDEQVPYLVNPIQWTTYSTTSFNSAEHDVGPVTLIQMDIMIRDTRAPAGLDLRHVPVQRHARPRRQMGEPRACRAHVG